MKTVLEVIKSTTLYFANRGLENPRLNIEHLLAHVLGKKRMELYLEFDRQLTDEELEPLRGLVKRRAGGEPLQHLLGTVEFCGHVFTCDKRALIPRPETEQFCELTLGRQHAPPARIVDVGTGSGVIALTLASRWPEAVVEAVDLSSDALTLATENAQRLGITDRVRIYESDLLERVEGVFDLVVANLPYIDAAEIPSLSVEVQRDPHTALNGGAGGLEILQRLISAAPAHLRGELALEIGHDQGARVRAELARHNYQDITVATDYQGRDRFVFAKYG